MTIFSFLLCGSSLDLSSLVCVRNRDLLMKNMHTLGLVLYSKVSRYVTSRCAGLAAKQFIIGSENTRGTRIFCFYLPQNHKSERTDAASVSL